MLNGVGIRSEFVNNRLVDYNFWKESYLWLRLVLIMSNICNCIKMLVFSCVGLDFLLKVLFNYLYLIKDNLWLVKILI